MNNLFAFQIVPGSDILLGYCRSMEETVTEAAAHRMELIKGRELGEDDDEVLQPIALYELRLKPLTLDLLLPVLNQQQELPEALVEEMTRVGEVEWLERQKNSALMGSPLRSDDRPWSLFQQVRYRSLTDADFIERGSGGRHNHSGGFTGISNGHGFGLAIRTRL
ncbi:hypothetical protein LXM96_17850 [Rhizobium sp. TRM95001]|nr:hypothetical protein [Rhizobium halophilum]